MAKIWFRVGMEAEVSEEELAILTKRGSECEKAEQLMVEIINRAELSGETYIPEMSNGCEEYNNPDEEINFLF